ncbi:BPSS1780 family membrane protein [Noviherbaspirillum sp.]|uniref:BPSS1780 family membrane protein n=1 Tax=Noviherbaspirillum sp. TaxID=1926288 RepID=UPI002FDF9D2E
MGKVPAGLGWLWLKEGFALFRKQPFETSTLFLSYLFLMFAVGIVPLLGQILPILLIPVFSMAFMQACVQIESGKKVYPSLLLTGFRSPAFMKLVQLGVLYIVAAIVAVAASALVDGGVFWQIMTGQATLDPQTVRGSNMSLAMIVAAIIYTPAAMAFWYAAPLIMWQKMDVFKAIFYSFFAVKRAGKAFFIYAAAWILIGVLLPSIVSSIIGLLLGRSTVMLVLFPLSLIMTVVMYCSFYPTYTHIFGRPHGTTPAMALPPAD